MYLRAAILLHTRLASEVESRDSTIHLKIRSHWQTIQGGSTTRVSPTQRHSRLSMPVPQAQWSGRFPDNHTSLLLYGERHVTFG
jgi:hypothetical protein